MNPASMDVQTVLDFYQVFLTLLVWMLATSACVGILVSGILLFLECHPFALGRKHAVRAGVRHESLPTGSSG